MTRYQPVDPKVDFPAMERAVIDFWRERGVFAESLRLRQDAPLWVFYEGPPTANGLPGIHHVEARTFKDVFPRYKTMTGHFVPRKAGWDCHGLPVEVEVEKEIGTKNKRDIEVFGIAEFVERCRASVTRYVGEWERLTERIGLWLDMDQAYWTMNADYVQSVWWALKQLHEQDLLFQDDKVTAYCPRCGTGLSDHEVAQGYEQDLDPSAFVRFPVLSSNVDGLDGAALVAWTTTPWTLISNLGLAVAANEAYVRLRVGDEVLVVADALRGSVAEDASTEQLGPSFPGSAMVGTRYEAPFDNVEEGTTHRVVAAAFVSMEDGTGIVHMAPAFGAEDLAVGRREGWPVFNPVDDTGRFTDLAPEYVRGVFVKDADDAILEDLRARGRLLRAERVEHPYPHCWRCKTPLLYYARPAWYVRTTARKQDLLAANETVNWFPDHIKHGRFGDWLANNIDWSLSRDRYWGTPLPIWRCARGHDRAVGSLAELSELAGRDVTSIDPHRPGIDDVTFDCPSCGGEARRVPQVIDTWFDSGAMPYAQWNYGGPGSEGGATFDERFPADLIAEAIDQTRGWFYTLMAEGVLLFGSNAYKNVLCLGLIVDGEGRKMSKSLGNILEPWSVIDRQGADALRWFLVATGSPWSTRRISMDMLDDVVRRVLLTLWNTYSFYVTYANIDQPDLASAPRAADRPLLDRWVLSRLHSTVAAVGAAMEGYDATGAARSIAELIDDLSNWYVRRSRRRFWDPSRGGGDEDTKLAAFATLEECLVTLTGLMAPLTPFVSEELYRNLTAGGHPDAPISVHLTDFPVADLSLVDPDLEAAMATVRSLVSLGRTVRTDAKVRVRQPLSRAVLHVTAERSALEPLLPLVKEELNAREVVFAGSAESLSEWRAKPNFRVLGPKLGQRVQEVAAALAADDGTLARELAAGGSVRLAAASGEVELGPDDVELVQQTQTGWGMASDGTNTVALDLALDDDLRREGAARELVRAVQDLRRSAGLGVTDRIELFVETSGLLSEALAEHRERIAGEVLAVRLNGDRGGEPEASAEVQVEGETARLKLRRV